MLKSGPTNADQARVLCGGRAGRGERECGDGDDENAGSTAHGSLYERGGRPDCKSGTQLGAEAVGEGLDDLLPQAGGILVRERPLGGLERDPERQRFLAGADLVAVVEVEDAHLAQLGPGGLAGSVHEVARRDALVDDEREILLHGRVGDHVLVERDAGQPREQVVEVELEAAERRRRASSPRRLPRTADA